MIFSLSCRPSYSHSVATIFIFILHSPISISHVSISFFYASYLQFLLSILPCLLYSLKIAFYVLFSSHPHVSYFFFSNSSSNLLEIFEAMLHVPTVICIFCFLLMFFLHRDPDSRPFSKIFQNSPTSSFCCLSTVFLNLCGASLSSPR